MSKIIPFTLILCCALCVLRLSAQQKLPVDYADPLIGTSESRWMLNPGATLPFGMVQLSPDNQSQHWKAGYEYTIGSVFGFSHIHAWTMSGLSVMPTKGVLNPYIYPHADVPITVMPTKGVLNPYIYPHADVPISTGSTAGHRSRIDKNTEKATPGYYSVDLVDFDIKTELTSTTRSGFFRFTFPETNEGHVFFNLLFPQEYETKILDAKITKVSDTEIEGYSRQVSAGWNDYTVHFVARFNKPFKLFGGWEEKDIVSLVSIDQARMNLEKELIEPYGWDFNAVKENARTVWGNLLGKIEVSGGSETNKTKFYTNLYRSYVARAILSDVNGKYVDPCEEIKQLKDPG